MLQKMFTRIGARVDVRGPGPGLDVARDRRGACFAVGDDVRVRFRPEGMSPDHSEIMTEYGLSDGDRIGTDQYPLVWNRAEPATS